MLSFYQDGGDLGEAGRADLLVQWVDLPIMSRVMRHNREHRILLHDLLRVGESKPLGYLPASTLECMAGVPRAVVKRWCRRRGLTYAFFPETECRVSTGAVYVASLAALDRLLGAHDAVLEKSGWPREPEAFLQCVATRLAKAPKPYALVGRAFADPRFPDGHPLLNAASANKQACSRRPSSR